MDKKVVSNKKLSLLLKSLIASYIVTGIILAVLSFILYKTELSGTAVSIGIAAAYLFSTFIGGIIVGKVVEEKRFIWGLILGIIYFTVIILVSIIFNKGISDQMGSLIMVFAMCSLGGMLGGMVS